MSLALAGLGGCATSGERPELNPSRWAPAAMQHEWQPGPGEQAIKLEAALEAAPGSLDNNLSTPAARPKYDLPALIDLALSRNPDTREAWAAARAAAAGWGISRAPFYPTVRVDSQNGYERIVDQVPKHWGTFKNWRSSDLLTVNYDLADFGRRDAAARSARAQLLAANLHFNRKIQEVVFAVEKSFYLLDAERASVAAAQAIVRLAITDRHAVERSRAAGLATKPDLLLALQREARSRFELENAELGVSDAQAGLAVALGARRRAAGDRKLWRPGDSRHAQRRGRPPDRPGDARAAGPCSEGRGAALARGRGRSGARLSLSDRRTLRLLRQPRLQLSVVESSRAASTTPRKRRFG
jgi:outer membrane protein TolC